MTPEALAALHALAFTDAPRPWPASAFAALAAEPTTVLVARAEGFALGRVAAGEAELLTLAVHPAARRRGVGTALIAAFEAEAAARGAAWALLEVAATNDAARALYAGLGYAEAGRRRGYYAASVDAVVLGKALAGGGRRADSI